MTHLFTVCNIKTALFNQGVEANLNWQLRNDCPYAEHTVEREQWLLGWDSVSHPVGED